MLIPEVEAHSIIDTTKLKTFMACPRKYFYEHVLGWRSVHPSHDLEFGICVHKAFEHIYDVWRREGRQGYPHRLLLDGYQTFYKTYRETFPEATDTEHPYKNPENFLRALIQYGEKYAPLDNFDVVFTEIAGGVSVGVTPTGRERKMHFRLDTVCHSEHGYFILEHKTSGWDKLRWGLSWKFATQVGIGLHVLHCLFGPETYGMEVNGIFLRAQPRFKQNGEPYANSGPGNEFERVLRKMSHTQMEDWGIQVNRYMEAVEREMNILSEEGEAETVMASFPKCETACFDYGRICPFHDYCAAWHNPLRNRDRVPHDMRVDHWDPRALDSEYTEVIDV